MGISAVILEAVHPKLRPSAGALAFFYGAWCHMGAAQKLYLPSVPAEDSPGYQEAGSGTEESKRHKQSCKDSCKHTMQHLGSSTLGLFLSPLYNKVGVDSKVSTKQSANLRFWSWSLKRMAISVSKNHIFQTAACRFLCVCVVE